MQKSIKKIGNYEEETLQMLEYRSDSTNNDKQDKVITVGEGSIKFAPQYASIVINKGVFKEIIRSTINR